MLIFTRLGDVFRRPSIAPTTPRAAHAVITDQNLEPREPAVQDTELTAAEAASAISGANVVGRLAERLRRKMDRGAASLAAAFHGYVMALFRLKSLTQDPSTALVLYKAKLAVEVLVDLKWNLKLRAAHAWMFLLVTSYLLLVDGLFMWALFRDLFGVAKHDLLSSPDAINAALFGLLTPVIATVLAALAGRALANLNGQYTLAHADEKQDTRAKLELIAGREWTWKREDTVKAGLLSALVLGAGVVFFCIGLYRFSSESSEKLLGVQLPVELFSLLLALLPITATAASWARFDAIKGFLDNAVVEGKRLRKQLDRRAKRADGAQHGVERHWLKLAAIVQRIVAAGNLAGATIEQIVLLASSVGTYRATVAPLATDGESGGAAAEFVSEAEGTSARAEDKVEVEVGTIDGAETPKDPAKPAEPAAWRLPKVEQRLSTTWPHPRWVTDELLTALRALDAYPADSTIACDHADRLLEAARPEPVTVDNADQVEADDEDVPEGGALVYEFPTEVEGHAEKGGVPDTM